MVLQKWSTCLCGPQDELPPQQEMRLGGVNGFLPYHAVATMMFSAMGPPPSEQEITGLRNRYLDKFLPSRSSKPSVGGAASGSDNTAAADAAGGNSETAASQPVSLQFGYCPIVDLSVPSQPQCVRTLHQTVGPNLTPGHCAVLVPFQGTLLLHLLALSCNQTNARKGDTSDET